MLSKKSDKITQLIINSFFFIFCALCLIPFLLVISISISNEASISEFGYSIIPKSIDLLAYRVLLADPTQIVNAYTVTIALVTVGTFCNLLINSLIAYPLSRVDFIYRKKISFYVYFTMLFSGGLVPSYILISNYLNMKDTFWVLFVPMMVSGWTILLFRTFMQSIPTSLIEAALIDGASELRIYRSIVVPLSKPAFATLGLFAVLSYWNDWFTPMLYINEEKLRPIQYVLQRNMQTVEFLKQNASKMSGLGYDLMKQLPTESARMALAVLVVLPIVLIFPFFQKYFVKGLTIGALKG